MLVATVMTRGKACRIATHDLVRRVALVTGVLLVTTVVATAQTAPSSTQEVPRGPDGKPDLSGIWQVVNAAAWDLEGHPAEKDVPGGLSVVVGGGIPYQPWAAKKKRENYANRVNADPETKCYLPGVPRITYMPYPFQIVQTPTQFAFLYEYVHAMRNVFVGSDHPPGHIDWWMGDSRAHWEGDTLVVDIVHFNDTTWFDRAGNFHSDELHVVERFTRTGLDHMTYDVTIEDPKVFTRPWMISMPLYRRQEANMQLLEYECYAFDDEFHAVP